MIYIYNQCFFIKKINYKLNINNKNDNKIPDFRLEIIDKNIIESIDLSYSNIFLEFVNLKVLNLHHIKFPNKLNKLDIF